MKSPIKALLLAAGLGTRLRPLTLNTPKCLVEINNKPILEDWIDKLEKINTKNILINTHYLSEKVETFLAKKKYKKIKITKTYEEKLLGTAGTLIANKSFFEKSLSILIHADNFTNFDLSKLINAHQNRPSYCLITMLTFRTFNPEKAGIVELDKNNVVKNFFEKSTTYHGNIANGAIYVFEEDFLEWVLKYYPNASDFSTQIIPNLMGKIFTFHTNLPYIDIGTLESLKQARKVAKNF